MRSGEMLKRLDRHMERGNAHMERGNEHMERGNELMERIRHEFDLSRQSHEETRTLMRELTLRIERVTQHVIGQLEEGRRELKAGRAVLVDLHQESMAQRSAILRVIDRLGPPGPATQS